MTFGLGMLLVSVFACDSQYSTDHPIIDELLRNEIEQQVEGQKLRQIASEVVMPNRTRVSNTQVPEQARPYIGRYKVVMRCEDPVVKCEQGTADFILSLLEDGTAHRSIIYLGTISFPSEEQHRQDIWVYQPSNHQIVLKRANGVEFFYDIDADGNIVMNLDKIAYATATNRAYFAKNNQFPTQAYKLMKIE